MLRMHPGWFRTTPWTDTDYQRVKRQHPEWFTDDATHAFLPWWR